MKKLFCSLLVLSFCLSGAAAEYFYLKSGEIINGKIVSEKDDSVTVSVAETGARKKIMIADIDEIAKTPKPASAAAVNKSAEDVQEAKTQFTSEFKKEKNEGETYVKDNKSGVLVFNVQETVIEKPKKSGGAQANIAGNKAADDKKIDAPLFEFGADNKSDSSFAGLEQKPAGEITAAAQNANNRTLAFSESAEADPVLSGANDGDKSPQEEETNKNGQPADEDYYSDILPVEDEDAPFSAAVSDRKKEKSEKMPDRPKEETFLALAFDIKGVNIFSGSIREGGVDLKGDKTENSDYGISLSAEQYGYISRFVAAGLGIGFQFKRCLKESPGRFGFLPLYAALKVRFVSMEDYHFYAVAHLGYNFLLANSQYLDKSTVNGGLYYAGGVGASYNSYVFQVLYCVNNASVNYSNSFAGDKVDRDVMHSKIGLYIGYLL